MPKHQGAAYLTISMPDSSKTTDEVNPPLPAPSVPPSVPVQPDVESLIRMADDETGDDNKPAPSEECSTDAEFQKEAEKNPEIAKIIDQIIAKIPKEACGVRPPQRRKEIIKIDSKCPPRTATIRRRLPSPEPDIIERVTVIKPPQDTINIIIEKPSMPIACCVERTEHEPPECPMVRHNVVCVSPSSKCPPGTKHYQYFSPATTTEQTVPRKQASSYASSMETSPFSNYSWQLKQPTTTRAEYGVPITIVLAPNKDEVEAAAICEACQTSHPKFEHCPKQHSLEEIFNTQAFKSSYSWPETKNL